MNKNLSQLDNLIVEILREKNLLQEREPPSSTEKKQVTIKLPKFKITESWGKPGNQDRALIEKFFNKIEGNTIQERIATLNAFISKCKADCVKQQEIPKVLANLVTLDTLSSIIYEFGASPAGFLFEAFLAALVGGTQIVPSKSISTEDIIDKDGVPVSIKLIKKDGYVHGSYEELKAGWGATFQEQLKEEKLSDEQLQNLANRLVRLPPNETLELWKQMGQDEDAAHNVSKLHGTTADNGVKVQAHIVDILTNPERFKDTKKEKSSGDTNKMVYLVVNKIKSGDGINLEWYQFPVTEEVMNGLKDAESGSNKFFSVSGTQFTIKKDYYQRDEFKLGTLELGSRESIIDVARIYAENLGGSMFKIFELVDNLSNNVNDYFLGDKNKGMQAASEARVLGHEIQKDFVNKT